MSSRTVFTVKELISFIPTLYPRSIKSTWQSMALIKVSDTTSDLHRASSASLNLHLIGYSCRSNQCDIFKDDSSQKKEIHC